MPFGLQGAPGIFQELMEQVCNQCKNDPQVSRLLDLKGEHRKAFLGAFFDDCGIGSQNEAEHLFILEEFFKVVQKNHLRIKLSKCDFLQETLDYLGYEISWGSRKPNAKKVDTLKNFKVKTLMDLRQFWVLVISTEGM